MTDTFRAFAATSYRDRFLALASSDKGLAKVRAGLAHGTHLFDARWMTAVPPQEQTPDGVTALLQRYGAPAVCSVFCQSADEDSVGEPLHAAVERLLGWGLGFLVICVPDRLAYYESEEQGGRFVLHRSR